MPIPARPTAGSASQASPQDGATSSSAARPTPSCRKPTRSSWARDRSGYRPCHAEAADQPSEPTINGALAAVSDQPWVEVSINGR